MVVFFLFLFLFCRCILLIELIILHVWVQFLIKLISKVFFYTNEVLPRSFKRYVQNWSWYRHGHDGRHDTVRISAILIHALGRMCICRTCRPIDLIEAGFTTLFTTCWISNDRPKHPTILVSVPATCIVSLIKISISPSYYSKLKIRAQSRLSYLFIFEIIVLFNEALWHY